MRRCLGQSGRDRTRPILSAAASGRVVTDVTKEEGKSVQGSRNEKPKVAVVDESAAVDVTRRRRPTSRVVL